MKLRSILAILIIAITLIAVILFNNINIEESLEDENDTTFNVTARPSNNNETQGEGNVATFEQVRKMKAGEIIDKSLLTDEIINELFFKEDIGEEIINRIMNISYKENPDLELSDLDYIRILHIGFDGNTHVGELIVNKAISSDIISIMKELYQNKYPIEKMKLIDEYNGDDVASMSDNNSSGFNYRVIANTSNLSNHAKGMAIDINPLYNPYITWDNKGNMNVSPESSMPYVDRDNDFVGKIDENDLCYKLFILHGFSWGGDWTKVKDYQHFEKKIN